MPDSKPIPDLPYHSFPTADAFTTFLSQTHSTLPAFYLKIAKKSSAIPSITAPEAVEVALCYGWIDGWGKSIDDNWYFVRYTPRRPKSVWSRKNVDTVGRLIADGRMREEGLRKVEEAKRDGRWERAYGGEEGMVEPEDLMDMLGEEGNERARKLWKLCSRSDRYSVLHRIQTASEKGRDGVIERIVTSLNDGTIPGKDQREKYTKKKKATKATSDEQGASSRENKHKPNSTSRTKAKPVASSMKVQRNAVEKVTASRRPGLRSRSGDSC
jgi:uncharacterized protein YdeI (YjbR/CyaY-like superfamily)